VTSAGSRAARLLDEAAARRCVPHPGLPMLAGQVDLILEFIGLGGHLPVISHPARHPDRFKPDGCA